MPVEITLLLLFAGEEAMLTARAGHGGMRRDDARQKATVASRLFCIFGIDEVEEAEEKEEPPPPPLPAAARRSSGELDAPVATTRRLVTCRRTLAASVKPSRRRNGCGLMLEGKIS